MFKYKAGNIAGSNQRGEKSIDLTDVPKQLPIKSDEEKAGIDYARAAFKYKAGNGEDNDNRHGKKSIGLTEVPTLPPTTTV